MLLFMLEKMNIPIWKKLNRVVFFSLKLFDYVYRGTVERKIHTILYIDRVSQVPGTRVFVKKIFYFQY